MKIFQSFDLDHCKIFQWNPCQIHTSSWQLLVGEIFTLEARLHSAFFEIIRFFGPTPIFTFVKSWVASDHPKEKLGGINFRVPSAINIRKQKGNFFVANDQDLTNDVFWLNDNSWEPRECVFATLQRNKYIGRMKDVGWVIFYT